ncbi:MAG: hypothetical protein ACFFD4_04015 [Candidatus Odinarchaeota archaeon]
MDYQTIIEYIAKKSGKELADIESLVLRRRKKLNMIIDNEAGARLVASDLVIELPSEQESNFQLKEEITRHVSTPADILTVQSLEELTAIRNNSLVTITLGVHYIREPREFRRKKDGLKGQVAFAGVFDRESNTTRLVFWNDRCKLIKNLFPGDELFIERVKVRITTYGGTGNEDTAELHLTNATVITRLGVTNIPERVKIGRSPVTLRLHEILDQRNFITSGSVVSTSEIKEFRRKDGSTGKLAKVIICDPETGKNVTVILWGDKSSAVDMLYENMTVIIRGYAKNGEIHVSNYGQIEIISQAGSVKTNTGETIQQ